MITTDWAPLPGAAHFETRTFAVGDVHGQSTALARLLDHMEGQVPTGEAAEIVFLGDLVDRGPDSLGAVHLAFSAGKRFGQATLLPGNHELMMLEAMERYSDMALVWMGNGGQAVLEEIDPAGTLTFDTMGERLRAALPEGWEENYRTGPTHAIRGGGVLFVHAGIHPGLRLEETFSMDRMGQDQGHWAWIRQPFLGWTGGWAGQGLDLVVHGHTPAYLKPIRSATKALSWLAPVAEYKAINLDAGSLKMDQVAGAEFAGSHWRLHIAPATAD